MDAFGGLLRETLVTAAVLCLPVLLAATLVGTAVAVIQAATQVQEQTLSLLPKIVVVGVAVALFGGYAMHLCVQLFNDAIAHVPALVQGNVP